MPGEPCSPTSGRCRSPPPYRRLFFGNTVAQLGQQMTNVAVAVQVYALTDSSFTVGLVGVFALVPLVRSGCTAGRSRTRWTGAPWPSSPRAGPGRCSLVLAAQAFLGNTAVGLLYACVAVQSGFYAANSPARSAMVAAAARRSCCRRRAR